MPALKAAWIVHTGAYRGARSSPETATIATPPRKLCFFWHNVPTHEAPATSHRVAVAELLRARQLAAQAVL